MGVAFPLSPAPAYYAHVTPSQPHGVYYVGGAPSFTLSQSGATAYSVRDYSGAVVSSGSVSGTTVTPAAPSGGWAPGWYRLYLTGGSSDALFGSAYGSTNFAVLRADSRFPALATGTVDALNQDLPNKAALGMGTSRLPIDNANAPTTGSGTIAYVQGAVTASKAAWNVASGSPYYDAARARLLWVNFPGRAYDQLTIGNLRIYAKDGTVDGSTVTVTAAAGTSSGTKLTVNAEVYDNLASTDAAVTALAASAYVRGFGTGTLATSGGGTLGNAYATGVALVVSTLYPDVTRFEGPENEPAMNAETAHKMRLFQAAVHAGNASALAIGPCPVSIAAATFEPFFAAGGGAWCDEISFHCYNAQTNADLNLGRTQLDALVALLAKYGLSSKPLWQTEAVHTFTSVYGVHQPRRARVPLLQTLQWEQYGVPRERNTPWYDVQHGFWTYPAWWQNSDGSLNPHAVLYRVLAEETFGQTHAQILDFGTIGNRIFLASVYSSAGAKTVVLASQSAMPGATVTLAVSATGALTAVDAFGNTSTVVVAGGRVVVPVADVPTYLRLPAGTTVSVVTGNDWPTDRSGWRTSAAGGNVAVTGTVAPAGLVNDDKLLTQYTAHNATDGIALGTAMPDTVTLSWPTATRLDRVIVWGSCWQAMSALVDFDVQTSNDGTTWTTQATVTKATPSSFVHGSDALGVGCQLETYWDEQWIYDVKLPAPVTAKMVRLNVRATSYGGVPDAACAAATAAGFAAASQYVSIQEIAVLCDDNTRAHYARQ